MTQQTLKKPAVTAKLCVEIETWRELEIQKLGVKVDSKEYNQAISELETNSLAINGFCWRDMKLKSRYRIPSSIERIIIWHMRKFDIIEKSRKKHGDKIENLYNHLGIGQKAMTSVINPHFIWLCRRKVESFIEYKGRMFKKQKLCEFIDDRLKWKPCTDKWLEVEEKDNLLKPENPLQNGYWVEEVSLTSNSLGFDQTTSPPSPQFSCLGDSPCEETWAPDSQPMWNQTR